MDIEMQQWESTVKQTPAIKPLSFPLSIAYFGVPAVGLFIGIHAVLPFLKSIGLTEFEAFATVITVTSALLIVAAVVSYHLDGFPVTWHTFSQRFRYDQFSWKDVLLGIGLFIAIFIGYGLFSAIDSGLIKGGLMPLPPSLPILIDPRLHLTVPLLNTMIGRPIVGNWSALLLYFVMLFFNIVGEELWWRGYILPRQELAQGRWTWLIHGLMWTLFHAFKWWDLIGLLPVCLLLSWAAQHAKRNWSVFIAHYLFNGLGFVIFALAVAGKLSL